MRVKSWRRTVALLAIVGVSPALAQGWKPDRTVEIVVNTAPASGPDKTARLLQKIFQDGRLTDAAIVVSNKPGGGGAIAYNYVNQSAGSGNTIAIASKSLLTAHVTGRMPLTYTDLTPIAHLFDEYIGVAVKADSPIRSGRDLIERLKKDPGAHAIGVATSLGNTNHQAVAAAMKTAGIDVRKLKNVVFQSGGNAAIALLGGHVDVVPVSIGSWVGPLKAGQVRIIAVSSPRRLQGLFADLPTWREQGADVVVSNWRSVVGPKGMTPPQIAFWETAIQRAMQTPDWKKEVESINAVSEFMGSAGFRKYLDADYAQVKAFLTELELAK